MILLSNFLLSLVLGSCFMSIQTQDLNRTDTTTIILQNNKTVKTTLNAENTSEVISTNTFTKPMTVRDVVFFKTTQDYQMSTEVSTNGATTQRDFVTKPTTPKSFPETSMTQKDKTTTASEGVTSTTVNESATSDSMPSTSLHETTSADLTSSEHHQYETTTAKAPMTTGSTESLNLTTISKQPTDMTESPPITSQTDVMSTSQTDEMSTSQTDEMSTSQTDVMSTSQTDEMSTSQTDEMSTSQTDVMSTSQNDVMSTSQTMDTTWTSLDVTSIISTPTLISTSQFPLNPPELPHTASGDDFLSAHSTPSTSGANVGESISPLHTDWFLIVIVCAVIISVLFASMLLFVQWQKRKSSGKFGPGYMNGQSKKSKKKKGPERDAWAGPVYLEAEVGVECEEEVQVALMSADGNDDVMLSTFAALDSDTPNCAVGEDGTEEAKKWEAQEPLLYIDEDAKVDNMEQTVGSNERQDVNEKVANGEMLNGGETFCITTAV